MFEFNSRPYLFPVTKATMVVICLHLFTFITAQQQVIPLYKGTSPGSENWNWTEGETYKNPLNTKIVYNVTQPTLIVYLPDPTVANGSAVIICLGGGFHVLLIDSIGTKLATELTKKGIAVFILKYRLAQSFTDDPWKEVTNLMKDSLKFIQKIAPVVNLAGDDLNASFSYILQHANEFKVDRKRIGVVGLSAGGALAANLAYNYTPKTRPAFVAALYTRTSSVKRTSIQQDAPPLFIAAAMDDSTTSVSNSVSLYNDWMNSKHFAELHLYTKGGHGLRGFPAESWIIRFEEWLDVLGFLKPKH
jgi:acetyl esterase/lipase